MTRTGDHDIERPAAVLINHEFHELARGKLGVRHDGHRHRIRRHRNRAFADEYVAAILLDADALLNGRYRFSLLSRLTLRSGEEIDVWSARDALVLKVSG